ncbi:hypothetical protein CBR_g34620 [Chara braunii]|uniref:Kinesin motor domain-containing protein n=1 Tax=Chara braunii TaxID=69332 RepID=A0A388LJ38_CHABU|nr:hypothetical protein CBR_g34620 [Chara braunii]|eukprot:GBG82336.1 hypothetical protein CBR_g34620 [Chara braunii]
MTMTTTATLSPQTPILPPGRKWDSARQSFEKSMEPKTCVIVDALVAKVKALTLLEGQQQSDGLGGVYRSSTGNVYGTTNGHVYGGTPTGHWMGTCASGTPTYRGSGGMAGGGGGGGGGTTAAFTCITPMRKKDDGCGGGGGGGGLAEACHMDLRSGIRAPLVGNFMQMHVPPVKVVEISQDSSNSGVTGGETSRTASPSSFPLMTGELVIASGDLVFDSVKQNAKKKLEALEQHLKDLKNECNSKAGRLQSRQDEMENLKAELASKAQEAESLAKLLEEKEGQLQCLRKEVDGSRIGLQQQVYAAQKALLGLQRSYQAFAEDIRRTMQGYSVLDDPVAVKLMEVVQKLGIEHEDLKKKFAAECVERKQLYNKVLELKGNIRVFCRCRPLSEAEVNAGVACITEFDTNRDELFVRTNVNGAPAKRYFKFDRVFGPAATQDEVFADTAPVVTSVLDGYNVCIFAYGQTGTGKTFTMEGTEDNRGVNYRTLEELFRIAGEREGKATYEIKVSVLEIYNEHIRDLLAPPPQFPAPPKKLEVKQGPDGGHWVPGLVETEVTKLDEVWGVLQSGSKNRAVGATNSNEHSSRSHCMLCVLVRGENHITGETTKSKLWLVDLAGSERVGKSEAQGDRLKEAQAINKSLSALGDVISALTTKTPHVPYRNSKLTHLLQDSLGGDSKTMMFVQISPNDYDVGESICSLNFASRVRGIELGPAKRQIDGGELVKYKQMVTTSRQEMRSKDEALKKLEDKMAKAMEAMEAKLKGKDSALAALGEKVRTKDLALADLEAQLSAERKALKEAKSCQAEAEEREARAQQQAVEAREAEKQAQTTLEAMRAQLKEAQEALAAAQAEAQATITAGTVSAAERRVLRESQIGALSSAAEMGEDAGVSVSMSGLDKKKIASSVVFQSMGQSGWNENVDPLRADVSESMSVTQSTSVSNLVAPKMRLIQARGNSAIPSPLMTPSRVRKMSGTTTAYSLQLQASASGLKIAVPAFQRPGTASAGSSACSTPNGSNLGDDHRLSAPYGNDATQAVDVSGGEDVGASGAGTCKGIPGSMLKAAMPVERVSCTGGKPGKNDGAERNDDPAKRRRASEHANEPGHRANLTATSVPELKPKSIGMGLARLASGRVPVAPVGPPQRVKAPRAGGGAVKQIRALEIREKRWNK